MKTDKEAKGEWGEGLVKMFDFSKNMVFLEIMFTYGSPTPPLEHYALRIFRRKFYALKKKFLQKYRLKVF